MALVPTEGDPGAHGEKSVMPMYEADLHSPMQISTANYDLSTRSVMAAGAVRHIFAEAKEMELAVLMRSIELGNSPVASQIARRILGAIAASTEPKSPDAKVKIVEREPVSDTSKPKGSMSPRELKVLRLIARGWSNQQIAEATNRSINTIEAQIKSVYRKLAVKSRTQAVREAMQQGLLNW